MPAKQNGLYTTADEDPVLMLADQIRARLIKSQYALMSGQGDHAHSLITENFCDQSDISSALLHFHERPTNKAFSDALGCLLVQAAQNVVTKFKTVDSMASYWRRTSTNVAVFESVTYIWSMLSFDVRGIVKYEFDRDKESIAGAVLGGLGVATRMIKNKWPGFLPEEYALPRLFLYPNDSIKAVECFCRVLLFSEGRILPLASKEVSEGAEMALNDAELALLPHIKNYCDEIMAGLGEAVSCLVTFYLDSGLD